MNGPMQVPPRPAAQAVPMVHPPSVADEDYITKKQVARRLRKPLRTIESWMHDGVLPFYKVKQAVRFRWSEVQAHLAAHYRVLRKRQLSPHIQTPTSKP